MSARSTGQQQSGEPSSLIERAWDSFAVMIGSMVAPQQSPGGKEPSSSSSSSGSKKGSSRESSSKDNSREVTADDLVELGVELILRTAIAVMSGYLIMRLSRKFLSLPNDNDQEMNAQPSSVVYRRLAEILAKRNDNGGKGGRNNSVILPALGPYEIRMAQEIVDPDEIEQSFGDIGGLDATKREIYELAILPLVKPELFQGKLVQPCKGILLYGKPGTGKTMLAKALAKEAQAVFLPLQLSKILNKWVGESNKLIAATFSLANKLQPAIIFIDELDTFLKANTTETAYLDSIKAEFLTLWDGVSTSQNSRVLVLGATNKPQTIDSAILRRMPRAFHVPLPNAQGRLSILTLILQGENVSPDVAAFLPELVRRTQGYSGSDLKELCKAAAMVGVQEHTAQFAQERVMGLDQNEDKKSSNNKASSWASIGGGGGGEEEGEASLRPMSKDDLLLALEKVQRTGAAAHEYGRDREEEEEGRQQREDLSFNQDSLKGLAALLRSLSVLSDQDDRNNRAGDEESYDDDDDDDDVPDI